MVVAARVTQQALEAIPLGSFVYRSRLPGTPAAINSAMLRALRQGELIRIRNGLYFKGFQTRYGMTRPSTEDVVFELLGRGGVGPTRYSAARALGLTTQVPAKLSVVTTSRNPPVIPDARIFTRSNPRRQALSWFEIAVLELLRGEWQIVVDGGWTALAQVLADGVSRGQIQWRQLSAAAQTDRSPSLRHNLARMDADLIDRTGCL